MIVTEENTEHVINTLRGKHVLAVDTETTGLRPYHGDVPFSVIINDGCDSYYFNFWDYSDGTPVLDPDILKPILSSPSPAFVFHNAKFDLAMLAAIGITVHGYVYDTMVAERVIDSNLFGHNVFSLDKTAARHGFEKDDRVEKYITKHKLYRDDKVEGKKTKVRHKFYYKVPFPIISAYGEKDAEVTMGVMGRQHKLISELKSRAELDRLPPATQVIRNEMQLVKTVYNMERRGVKIDRGLCEKAVDQETRRAEEAIASFENRTGREFKVSGKLFAEVLAGEDFVFTDKGNASFDSDVLKTFKSPVAKDILQYKEAKANLNYYQGFLYHADEDDIIHANFNQHFPRSGRFSSSSPNLQNLKKTSEEDLTGAAVRRAFVPRAGHYFAMLDYDQMEYKLLLDYAGDEALVGKVKSGLDVHQVTADFAGVVRKTAKAANFAIIYGSGDETLGKAIGTDKRGAKAARNQIFSAAPRMEDFICRTRGRAKKEYWVTNWFGRRINYPNGMYTHKAVNYLVQGGCADVLKIAMNRIEDYLHDKASKMVLTIHDEIVIEVKFGEDYVLAEIKKIMETVYPFKHLPLTCGIDYSLTNLADKHPYTIGEVVNG